MNIQVRAKVLNGQFAITSEPGKGTSVYLQVPYLALNDLPFENVGKVPDKTLKKIHR